MKKTIFLLVTIAFALSAMAQNKSSVETKMFLRQLKTNKSVASLQDNKFVQNFNLRQEKGQYFVGVVAKVSDNFSSQSLEQQGITLGSKIKNIVTLQVPVEKLYLLENNSEILQYDIARRVYPTLNRTRIDTKADSVQQGLDLPSGLSGDGVLVGITDWGFDYTHPNFYDTTRTIYRVYKAWDQFKTSGPHPAGFNYGTEFSTQSDLLNAKCDTSNIYDYATHASHVAGIIGGSGAGTKYRGMAPGVQYMFVSFLLDEAAALDAFSWLRTQARAANKRLVVNMSWGMYCFGTLDGSSLLSQAIDAYSQEGITFVTSAGNNGDVNFHIKKTFDTVPDTLRTIIKFGAGVGEGIALWGTPNTDFQVGMAVSNNDTIIYTPFFNTADTNNNYIDSTIVIGSDTIFYDITWEKANPNNARPHAFINISQTQNKAHLFFTSHDSTTVHAWNVYNKQNHAGNTGVAFASDNLQGYSNGDHYYGISEPSTASSCITVASHIADNYRNDTTFVTGGISSFSSFGPTISGMQKPDISAPGATVVSSMSSYTTESFTQTAYVFFHNRSYKFAALSGTSMASPTVAGAVALLLEANPNLTPAQIKNIIIETARTDDKTGAISTSGDLHWGHGKLDVMAAVKKALQMSGIEPVVEKTNIKIYPNPARNFIVVENLNDAQAYTINIFSLDGKLMKNESASKSIISLTDLPAGIYVLQLKSQTESNSYKLLITK